MFMVIFLIADLGGTFIYYLEQFLIYASLILTIISLIDYLVKNKDIIKSV